MRRDNHIAQLGAQRLDERPVTLAGSGAELVPEKIVEVFMHAVVVK